MHILHLPIISVQGNSVRSSIGSSCLWMRKAVFWGGGRMKKENHWIHPSLWSESNLVWLGGSGSNGKEGLGYLRGKGHTWGGAQDCIISYWGEIFYLCSVHKPTICHYSSGCVLVWVNRGMRWECSGLLTQTIDVSLSAPPNEISFSLLILQRTERKYQHFMSFFMWLLLHGQELNIS